MAVADGKDAASGALGAVATSGWGSGFATTLGLTNGSMAAAAAEAGFASLCSQAAVGLVNNKGDVLATLQGLASDQGMRALASAMLTASLTNGLTTELAKYEGIKEAVTAGGLAGKVAQDAVIGGTVQAGVSTALYGGNLGQNLLDGLRGAAVSSLGAKAANEIGAAAKAGDLDYVTHKIAHAALGGAMAAADGKDAASGALGAVVGEVTAAAFLANKLKTGVTKADMPALEELGINYGKLAAGLVAAISGADVGTASMTADNAARNNWAESAWDLLFVFWDVGKIQYGRYINDKGMVQEGFIDLAADSAALLIPMVPAGMTRLARAGEKTVASTVSREIKLVDGFYEAESSAFKFSKHYYEKLGIPKELGKSPRLATPFLAAEEVLRTSGPIMKDYKPGFYKYDNGVMEMIYNPKTKEVWHLQHK